MIRWRRTKTMKGNMSCFDRSIMIRSNQVEKRVQIVAFLSAPGTGRSTAGTTWCLGHTTYISSTSPLEHRPCTSAKVLGITETFPGPNRAGTHLAAQIGLSVASRVEPSKALLARLLRLLKGTFIHICLSLGFGLRHLDA